MNKFKSCANKNCSQKNPQLLENFHIDRARKDNRSGRCKKCRCLMTQNWQRIDPTRAKGANLKKHYWPQLTWKDSLIEYDKLFLRQNGACFICKKKESDLHQSGQIKRLAVDHDHKTGKIRGLLCSKCNKALGLINDDFNIALNICDYIQQHRRIANEE